jgi:hypothetical protein
MLCLTSDTNNECLPEVLIHAHACELCMQPRPVLRDEACVSKVNLSLQEERKQACVRRCSTAIKEDEFHAGHAK